MFRRKKNANGVKTEESTEGTCLDGPLESDPTEQKSGPSHAEEPVAAAAAVRETTKSNTGPYEGPKNTKLRSKDFRLAVHHHGKAKVRVLKVRHTSGEGGGETHSVSEYTVHTRLFSPEYEKVFSLDDNSDLVATDTQKNTVYIVAKRTEASSPEQFGIDIAKHFLAEYPILTGCHIEVEETLWERATVDGAAHEHAFLKKSPEMNCAVVEMDRTEARGTETPAVMSQIRGMTILKTTQSGFANFHKDGYTLLPDCDDRCLATELTAEWACDVGFFDFNSSRAAIRAELIKGLFGPAQGGVFSVSLQATIYDAACLALTNVPELARINISTPNLHYLPTTASLKALGVVDPDVGYVRDVFMPTSEPSGTIFCEVTRE